MTCRAGRRGALVNAPTFTWKNWFAMLGPGLLVGGSAIGGGEWLAGPAVTARYGGALMWLATLSILGPGLLQHGDQPLRPLHRRTDLHRQVSHAARPAVLAADVFAARFGAVFPYLAANAATPLAAVYLGHNPSASKINRSFAG